MRISHSHLYGFHVEKTQSGWTWAAYDADGGVLESGAAPHRAAAAACVIRVLARAEAGAHGKGTAQAA